MDDLTFTQTREIKEARDAILRVVETRAGIIWPNERPRDSAVTLLSIVLALRIAELAESPAGLLMLSAGIRKSIGEITAAEWTRLHG